MNTTVENAEIDLTPFCATDEHSRYRLTEPFVRGGWKAATDSKILVAIPTTEPDSTTEGKFPKVEEFIDPARAVEDSRWQDWPALALVDGKDICPRCEGVGTVGDSGCKVCHGKSHHVCACGYEHSCNACKQEGCRNCAGTGEAVFPCLQPVSSRHFFRDIDAKARLLPQVQWAEDSIDPVDPLHLRFRLADGTLGYGRVMPASAEALPKKAGGA